MNNHIQHKATARKSPAQPHPAQFWTLNKSKLNKPERIGKCAENLVIWHLQQLGWTIRARNFQTHKGEIDIIASRLSEDLCGIPTIAFVEVKSRSSDKGLPPETNVTAAKRQKIIATMKQWIGFNPREKAVYRCDIASVLLIPHRAPKLQYFKNAFCGREQFGW